MLYAQAQTSWPFLRLNDTWKFKPGSDKSYAQPVTSDEGWADIKTTEFWEEQGYPNLDGFAWYRQQVFIPRSWKSKVEKCGGLYLSYSSADDCDEAFFNGKSLGKMGDFPPNYQMRPGEARLYRVAPSLVRYGKVNTIAVCVYDGGGKGGILSHDIFLSAVNPVTGLNLRLQSDDADWVFDDVSQAVLHVSAQQHVSQPFDCDLVCRITTDTHEDLGETRQKVSFNPNADFHADVKLPLDKPGFYHVEVFADHNGLFSPVASANVGIRPTAILSPYDAQADFDEFWKTTRKELDTTAPNFTMTLDSALSNNVKRVYRVEMTSFGGLRINAMYSVPRTGGRHPALLTNLGYGQGVREGTINASDMPDYCELLLSVRGQGLQQPSNPYGEWITYGLQNQFDYYYRGAYMDLVRAVDFLCSRPEVDTANIFASGISQGGALTYAVGAIDHRIRAIAPCVPFLSDFPDYFRIVSWPKNLFDIAMLKDNSLAWEHIYRVLSYFDIKNLSHYIQCPVLMSVGLQDDICPPHTNFAGFNNVPDSVEKHYIVYPHQGHGAGDGWWDARLQFFKAHMKQDLQ